LNSGALKTKLLIGQGVSCDMKNAVRRERLFILYQFFLLKKTVLTKKIGFSEKFFPNSENCTTSAQFDASKNRCFYSLEKIRIFHRKKILGEIYV
jgi:hypothetical protein